MMVVFVTSAKEVMFLSALICLLVSRVMQKLLTLIFSKFGGKVAHGPCKKPLDFDENPDYS